MDDIETRINTRITTLENEMNKQFVKFESFAQNTRARELGVPYTPLVKEDGAAIRDFPCTFNEVDALASMLLLIANRSFLTSCAEPLLSTLEVPSESSSKMAGLSSRSEVPSWAPSASCVSLPSPN